MNLHISRRICLSAESVNNRDGELVAAFVLRVANMAANPFRLDLVDRAQPIELLPKLDIHHRAFLTAPTAALPTINPLVQAFHQLKKRY